MKDYQGFKNNGNWYKGNLHTHTTLSDGRATPEETFALYKAEGYSFMALTDHRKRYPGFEDRCTGAQMVDADVVTDGPITTGRALGTAMAFALELVRLLTDEQTANFYFLGTDGDPQLQRALSEVRSLKN